MDLNDLKTKLRQMAFSKGAGVFGVCRIDDLRETFHPEIKKISEKLKTAISIGVPLASPVLRTLVDRPNMIYKAHYRQVNAILDDTSFAIASEIERNGQKAMPLPASMVLKRFPMVGHLSHRVIAHEAGLGWWGRNNLLVSKDYGSQVRLVTILTNAQFETDMPIEEDCGDCFACLSACPVNAISENKEEFNLKACSEQVQKFAQENNYGMYICGLCLKPCRGKIY
jgi:epoxyqueuosine reductase QueG